MSRRTVVSGRMTQCGGAEQPRGALRHLPPTVAQRRGPPPTCQVPLLLLAASFAPFPPWSRRRRVWFEMPCVLTSCHVSPPAASAVVTRCTSRCALPATAWSALPSATSWASATTRRRPRCVCVWDTRRHAAAVRSGGPQRQADGCRCLTGVTNELTALRFLSARRLRPRPRCRTAPTRTARCSCALARYGLCWNAGLDGQCLFSCACLLALPPLTLR